MAASQGFARFLALFGGLYGAYGCLSPLLPNVMAARGLGPAEIGTVLGTATLVRLAAGPLAGRYADAHRAARAVLALAAVGAGLAALAHGPVVGFWPVLMVGLVYAMATAPLAPLADALALAAARGGAAFAYGHVRGAGSAAFIAASAATGWLVEAAGLGAALVAGGVLFLATGALARAVPQANGPRDGSAEDAAGDVSAEARGPDGWRLLLANAPFRRTVLVAALVIGAHALHEAFAMILWLGAGIGAGAAGLLWAESVAAEVLVFLLLGPPTLRRIGPAYALALAAGAGALRWAVMAQTVAIPWLMAAQALHGFSFALLHLACLGLIEGTVPGTLRATALALYGSVGLGLAGALVTLAAGPLFGAFGARAFWGMALLSLCALPLALSLRPR
ncbi:MFS transporter [Methylobacterium symbioticum]|uniref:Putative 3-phenylpropionic acid transporter n=1 Tax=Methylobacterium symbioticum TaxID=2584084 RepID=A0A509EBQ3_9HYPH|nr:MFS transporter [Methylobacterium symbioticum]VUD71054.1 putative 3-phenylpropionic acid transporter [Methylobacterium symbioticum]